MPRKSQYIKTAEHRKNLSLSMIGKNLGRPRPQEVRDKIRKSSLGVKNSAEQCEKNRLVAIGKEHPWSVGEKNHNWKGGITPKHLKIRGSRECYRWRISILKKHSYECQICKKTTKIVHHLFNFADYPELRLDLENGMSICKDHHMLFHVKYGRNHNTPRQMVEFVVNLNLPNGSEVNSQIAMGE